MVEILFYAGLAVPWAAMAYIVVADEISCWKPYDDDDDDDEKEPSGWTAPSTARPRCGGSAGV